MTIRTWCSAASLISLFAWCSLVEGSANVLPKGVFSFYTTYYHYGDIDSRYDPDGKKEDIAVNYNSELDSSVFPALAPLDPLVGGVASIGNSVVDFEFIYRWWEFGLDYGLTDNVSVGILIPVSYTKNRVRASLDTSTANVGKNPVWETPSDPFGSPVIPIAFGGIPLETEDVQDLLGNGLDVNGNGTVDVPGFGYQRFDTYSSTQINDIEIAAKHKFYDSDVFRLAYAGGIRLPTGNIDDPDNLTSPGFGDGTTDLLLRFLADYKGLKNWLFSTSVAYDIQLPDDELRRIQNDVNEPLTVSKEVVDRDLGDVLEVDLVANYSITSEWSTGLTYRYTAKSKDDIDGNLGLNYQSLEDETDSKSHMAILSVGYSTVDKYLAGKSSIPYSANLSYRNRFDGENNVTDSYYVSLDFNLYFK